MIGLSAGGTTTALDVRIVRVHQGTLLATEDLVRIPRWLEAPTSSLLEQGESGKCRESDDHVQKDQAFGRHGSFISAWVGSPNGH